MYVSCWPSSTSLQMAEELANGLLVVLVHCMHLDAERVHCYRERLESGETAHLTVRRSTLPQPSRGRLLSRGVSSQELVSERWSMRGASKGSAERGEGPLVPWCRDTESRDREGPC